MAEIIEQVADTNNKGGNTEVVKDPVVIKKDETVVVTDPAPSKNITPTEVKPDTLTKTEVAKETSNETIQSEVAKALAKQKKEHDEEINKIKSSQESTQKQFSEEETTTLKTLTEERKQKAKDNAIYKELVGKFDETILKESNVKQAEIPQLVSWLQSNFGLTPEVVSKCNAKALTSFAKQYHTQKISTYNNGNVYNSIVGVNDYPSDLQKAQQNQMDDVITSSFGKRLGKDK